MSNDVLIKLAKVIASRRLEPGSTSYTRQLLYAGVEKCAKKFGEEAIELIIASGTADEKSLKAEAADVLYHLLVLLEARQILLSDVLTVLEGRMGTSGIAEKASRGGS